MSGSVFVDINGVSYDGFRAVEVKRSFTALTSEFTLSTVFDFQKNFLIKVGDRIDIYIDETQIFAGFVERCLPDYDASHHDLTFSGRDKTCDLVDSTCGNKATFNPPITLLEITRIFLSRLSITDISVTQTLAIDPFSTGELQSADISQTVFDFIENLVRLRQVFLVNDGAGNILLTRASTRKIQTLLLSRKNNAGNNILSSSAAYDFSNRFHTYTIYSQSNPVAQPDFDENVVEATARLGSAVDSDIRASRRLDIMSEKAISVPFAQSRAIWERNIRRAQSRQYNCAVSGFYAEKDNILWQPNLLVHVDDELANISADMLINEVTYHFAADRKDVALTLVDPAAFEVVENPRQARSNFIGDEALKKATEA